MDPVTHTVFISLPLFSKACVRMCEHLCITMFFSFLWFIVLNVNGLPYSKNNDVKQRKPLIEAAPHLLKGRG